MERDEIFWMKLSNKVLSARGNKQTCKPILSKWKVFSFALLKLQADVKQCNDNLGMYGV